METFFEFVDFHNTQVLVIGMSCLTLTAVSFAFIWMYNRKRFHNLKHQIPASVVHNYIESIIQNSTALKSSLFRGLSTSPLEGERSMHASVVPLSHLAGGVANEVGASTEEMNAKNAEIAVLKSQLKEKNSVLSEVEDKMNETNSELKQAMHRLKDIEANPKAADKSNNSATNAELEKMVKERDELKSRLDEYGVIADDLVNLKKLKQENEQLRRSLNIPSNEEIPKKENESAQVEAKNTKKNEVTEVAAKNTKKNEVSEVEAKSSKTNVEKDIDNSTSKGNKKDQAGASSSSVATEEDENNSQVSTAADNVIPFAKKEDDKNKAEDTESVVAASAAVQPAASAKAEDKPAPDVPEDLLSEFEKMLG